MEKPIHLSIEGMDGVGKSTLCQSLAQELSFSFVEKPFHLLSDKEGEFTNYLHIRDNVNASHDRNMTALFYGVGSLCLYERYRGKGIVTDRHLASNYAWSGVADNHDVYDLLVNKLGAPKLTVLLYANSETIIYRLKCRNNNDSDIEKAILSDSIFNKMKVFCTCYHFPFLVLDTTHLTIDEEKKIVLEEWRNLNEHQ